MSTELDEVYIAHIKSMFIQFDDEIIRGAIFEHGYDKDGNYNSEKAINYLLDLSGDNIEELENNVLQIDDKEPENTDNNLLDIITQLPNLFSSNTHEYSQINNEDKSI